VSQLATNVLHFARLLRAAGLPLGPASVESALEAVCAIDVTRRAEFYWALHAVFVHRREEHEVFDHAFRLFFRDPYGVNEALALLLPKVKLPPSAPPEAGARRVAEALEPPARHPLERPPEVEIDATWSYAPDQTLRTRDFEQMTAEELRRAKRLVAQMDLGLAEVSTRRMVPHPHGGRVDMRRTVRQALRAWGDAGPLAFRRTARRPPPLVVLCDISGSMSRYTEMLLHFLHALATGRDRVHTFLFGTELVNVTRTLRHRDPDLSLRQLGAQVQDWAGGTRLRQCLHDFNHKWSRRMLAQGAVVVLITDGLDRDPVAGLGAEAERLHKSCRRLIWLNPLLRYAQFEPKAQGIRALLPHVDEHRPVHDLSSLESLARALATNATRAPHRSRDRSSAR
jgi:uncharacterized protein with von Willebrand factor type A (vWA) domain